MFKNKGTLASEKALWSMEKKVYIETPKLTTQQTILTNLVNAVLDLVTGKLLVYCQLIKSPKYHEAWNIPSANEFGRLTQRVGGQVNDTDTTFYIHKHEVPTDDWKDASYVRFAMYANRRLKKLVSI